MAKDHILGIEFGSTRIKGVVLDKEHKPQSTGDYTWSSRLEKGIWTYDLERVWEGLKTVLSQLQHREKLCVAGISGMMHGYLAFDKDWNLLVPFRTWQNTITPQAAEELTELFSYNMPQRWSTAHIYQAVLNGESHISQLAHVTTLAGYVHYMLTGVNAVGLTEASGMFPIDPETLSYDETRLDLFDKLPAVQNLPWKLRDLLPDVLPAGAFAGALTEDGAARIDGLLPVGIPFAPPEGDAATGMVATNAVSPGTGNVSAGTSIFAMVVLEKPICAVYEEVDLIMTPTGKPVVLVHGSNCTGDSNAWAKVLKETAQLFGADPTDGELFTKLYEKSLEGDPDCGGVMVCNYITGEHVTGCNYGRPLVARKPESVFTLANFFRSQIYSAMATLKLGLEILENENVTIRSLTGHGGLFTTRGVGQRYLAAACNVPVQCMETAAQGGPYGMALLASFCVNKNPGQSLEDYLNQAVFRDAQRTVENPRPEEVEGFKRYMQQYKALLQVEKAAVENLL